MVTRVALLASLLLLVGCAAQSEPALPAEFTGTVEYGNGSVAPPYHYEWRLHVDESTATVEWTPGYADTEPWRETVDITADQRLRFYDRLRDSGVLDSGAATGDGMAGGPTGSVALTIDGEHRDSGTLGLSRASQRVLDDVVAAARDLVPADVWTGLEDRQRDWTERQPK